MSQFGQQCLLNRLKEATAIPLHFVQFGQMTISASVQNWASIIPTDCRKEGRRLLLIPFFYLTNALNKIWQQYHNQDNNALWTFQRFVGSNSKGIPLHVVQFGSFRHFVAILLYFVCHFFHIFFSSTAVCTITALSQGGLLPASLDLNHPEIRVRCSYAIFKRIFCCNFWF